MSPSWLGRVRVSAHFGGFRLLLCPFFGCPLLLFQKRCYSMMRSSFQINKVSPPASCGTCGSYTPIIHSPNPLFPFLPISTSLVPQQVPIFCSPNVTRTSSPYVTSPCMKTTFTNPCESSPGDEQLVPMRPAAADSIRNNPAWNTRGPTKPADTVDWLSEPLSLEKCDGKAVAYTGFVNAWKKDTGATISRRIHVRGYNTEVKGVCIQLVYEILS